MLARLLSLLVLLAAVPAAASTLPFTATLDLFFAVRDTGVVLHGGGLANVSSSAAGLLTGVSLPAGVFQGSFVQSADPNTTDVPRVEITVANGAGTFALTANGGGGALPLPGLVRLCLFSRCDGVLTPPATTTTDSRLTRWGGAQKWPIALGPVGNGGSQQLAGTFFTFTVVGAAWTKGFAAASVPGQSSLAGTGFAHGPLSNTGTTAQAGGVLALVTPISIHRGSLDYPDEIRDFAGFGFLLIEFTPEPASGALVALGLGLLAAGRRRRRS